VKGLVLTPRARLECERVRSFSPAVAKRR